MYIERRSKRRLSRRAKTERAKVPPSSSAIGLELLAWTPVDNKHTSTHRKRSLCVCVCLPVDLGVIFGSFARRINRSVEIAHDYC